MRQPFVSKMSASVLAIALIAGNPETDASADSKPSVQSNPTALSAPASPLPFKIEEQTHIEYLPFAKDASVPESTTLFEDLPPSRTGVAFQLTLPDIAEHIHEMIHLSVYGGICTGDYDGDGQTDFYVTSPAGGNRLFRNLGDFRFEDVTEKSNLTTPHLWGTGATFVDIDNDGDLDIYACGYKSRNRLFINQGSGPDRVVHFEERAEAFGLAYEGASMTMAFADMDRDGDLDAYLATTAMPPPPGVRFRVEYDGNKPVIPKELQEYWAMNYMPGERAAPTEAGQFDHLYRNEGGHFTEVTKEAGIDGPYFTLSALWWDYDSDGWLDLYVSNDYLGPDILYRNNHDGTFTNVIRDTVPHTPWSSMGTDIGDINNDGLMDFLATDMLGSTHYRRQIMRGETSKTGWFLDFAKPRQYVRNALYLNTGGTRMIEAATIAGIAATDWTWGPRIEDFDNDGWVDAFVCNGMLRDVQNTDLAAYADRTFRPGSSDWAKFWAQQPLQKEVNLAFQNQGRLEFQRVEKTWGLDRLGVSLGSATADFDNDGNLDLIVNNADAPVSIYRNHGTRNSIRVRLKGTASNRFGVGATVKIRTKETAQFRQLTMSRAWLSASEPILSFGLGDAGSVDSLTVNWPSGKRQQFTNLPANRFYTITESVDPSMNDEPERPLPHTLFVESDELGNIVSEPTPFDDFEKETLLPKRLSERTFCLAFGDVDNDGDDDLFLGGTVGKEGQLYIHEASGRWIRSPQPSFLAAKESEDTAAQFFDADSDGDLDLYVVSGGVRQVPGHASYRDRLFLNKGSGIFQATTGATLPGLFDPGSCISVSDFDHDGDPDLFTGSGSIPGRYPLSGSSRLLRNERGEFIDVTHDSLRDAGIVNDALWSDFDNDGWQDLLVAIEWGSIKLFRNAAGHLVDQTEQAGISLLTGMWNALSAGDLDGDGDIDFIAGNLGLNTQYRATPQKPELLFYGDLDESGKPNLLEAYFVGEFGFPHRGLDSLSEAMPSLREKFTTFHQFATSPIERVTTMERLRKAQRREANTLASGVFFNDGKGRFRFEPLPELAQIAPARDLELIDVNADGILDLIIAQNDFSPYREMGRMDGGVSLLLLGDRKGAFKPLLSSESGISINGEALRCIPTDLNGDGQKDLVFGVAGGRFMSFLMRNPP